MSDALWFQKLHADLCIVGRILISLGAQVILYDHCLKDCMSVFFLSIKW